MAVQPCIECIPIKKINQMSMRNSWGLLVKSKVTSCNGPVVLRQLNLIQKRAIIFKVIVTPCFVIVNQVSMERIQNLVLNILYISIEYMIENM